MPEQVPVKHRAVSGVKWIWISTVITAVFLYAQVAVLARFLSPADFGIVAMALVVTGLAQSFTDIGISNAVIQRQGVSRDSLSSLYWLEIAVGISFFVLIALATPWIVGFYREPRLSPVMIAAGAIFLVTPPGQLFQILLQKDLEFRKMAVIDIGSSFVSTIITIAAGLSALAPWP